MKKRYGLAGLGIAVLAAAALLWPTPATDVEPARRAAAAQPSTTPVVPQRAGLPVAATNPTAGSTATMDAPPNPGDAATTSARTEATVRVFGRMPTAVSFRVSGTGGAIDDRVRTPAADHTFSIEAMPLARCDIAGFCADGTQWQRHFERPVAEAERDWDLGTVDANTEALTVDIEVHFTQDIVQALVACDCEELQVRLHDQDARPVSLAEHTFEVSRLLRAPSPLTHSTVAAVRCAATPVQISWSLTGRKWGLPGGFHSGFGVANGGRRQLVRIDLLPSTTIRGHVEWDDGERAPEVEVRCATPATPIGMLRTGRDGSFCFVVEPGAKATLDLDVLASMNAGRPVGTHTAMAGDTVTLRRGPRVRWRLLGDDGRPVEQFTVFTHGTRSRLAHHPGGIASELPWVLAKFPWIQVHVAPDSHVFLVPAGWLTAPETVHELRLADRLPTGSVEIVGDTTIELRHARFLVVALVGESEIAGLQVLSATPKSWPWLVPNVPVGRYRVELQGPGAVRPAADARPVVTVTASTVTRIDMPW